MLLSRNVCFVREIGTCITEELFVCHFGDIFLRGQLCTCANCNHLQCIELIPLITCRLSFRFITNGPPASTRDVFCHSPASDAPIPYSRGLASRAPLNEIEHRPNTGIHWMRATSYARFNEWSKPRGDRHPRPHLPPQHLYSLKQALFCFDIVFL